MAPMDLDMIYRPSPNFDDRTMPVSMIVLHYTGMPDAESALNRLTPHRGQGLRHYFIPGGRDHLSPRR